MIGLFIVDYSHTSVDGEVSLIVVPLKFQRPANHTISCHGNDCCSILCSLLLGYYIGIIFFLFTFFTLFCTDINVSNWLPKIIDHLLCVYGRAFSEVPFLHTIYLLCSYTFTSKARVARLKGWVKQIVSTKVQVLSI